MNDEEIRQLVIASVRDIVADPRRYGLVWRRLPATVVDGTSPSAVTLIIDGDENAVTGVSLLGKVAGRVMVDVVPPSGLYVIGRMDAEAWAFQETVYFDSTDTFDIADYPNMSAVRVRVQAGGGAGSGAPLTGAGASSGGGGGQGGGYAESFIEVDDLDASTTVTVSTATTAGTGTGTTGGTSSFGTTVVAIGGAGGVVLSASTAPGFGSASGGAQANLGNLVIEGGGSAGAIRNGAAGAGGIGGDAVFGHGGKSAGGNQVGTAGAGYGGGGGGAGNNENQAAKLGGDGAPGLVIVDIYV